jgi:uncharacterized protein (TIGR00251 family)
MLNYSFKNGAITFTAKIVPRASKSEIVGEWDSALKIRISAPPVDGAANNELIKVISKFFGVSKSAIEIVSGDTSKIKRIRIDNLSDKAFFAKLK